MILLNVHQKDPVCVPGPAASPRKKNYNVSTVGIFELYGDSSAHFLRKKHEHSVFMVPMGLGSKQMIASFCNSKRRFV